MIDTKVIRLKLKETLGYNARQVSVSFKHHTTILFTIRDTAIKIEEIENFGKQYEAINEDKETGEIFSGGLYARVRYSQ